MKKFLKIILFILIPLFCNAQSPTYISTDRTLQKKYGDWRDSIVGRTIGTIVRNSVIHVDKDGTITLLKSDTIPVMILFSDTAFWSQAEVMWTKGYKIIDWSSNESYLLDYHNNRMKSSYFIWLVKERKK